MGLIIKNLKVILKGFDKNKITDIFFDLDHTLWDFEKNSELTFKKIFNLLNIEISLNNFFKIYSPINHKLWKLYRENKISRHQLRFDRLKATFIKLKIKIDDDMIIKISEMYLKFLSDFTFLHKGALDTLSFLKKKYNLHIISNGFEDVQKRKIKNSGLNKYFDNIYTSEAVGYKKPNPNIFKFILNNLNIEPCSGLMIGDSKEADIIGALNFGLSAIHFNSQNEPIHNLCLIIKDLKEIKSYL